MVPLGIGVSVCSLVGNAIGAQKQSLAISLGKRAILGIFVVEIAVSLILFFGGSFFVVCFSNDGDVKSAANHIIPFLSIFVIFDGLQGVCSGVLRGTGKQFIGAVTNVIAFYGLGLPLAWLFCFTLKIGVRGLFLGISCGTLFQVVVLGVLITCYERYIFGASYIHLAEGAAGSHGGPKQGFTLVKTTEEEEREDKGDIEDDGRGIAMNVLHNLTDRHVRDSETSASDTKHVHSR